MNAVAKLGLVILVASLSALAGNIISDLRFFGSYSSSGPLASGISGKLVFLKSTEYSISLTTDGTVEFMVLRLGDMMRPDVNYAEMALAYQTISGGCEVSFRPDRRGVYALVFRNLSDRRLNLGYVFRAPTSIFEQDYLLDSATVASAGLALAAAGLVIGRRQKH